VGKLWRCLKIVNCQQWCCCWFWFPERWKVKTFETQKIKIWFPLLSGNNIFFFGKQELGIPINLLLHFPSYFFQWRRVMSLRIMVFLQKSLRVNWFICFQDADEQWKSFPSFHCQNLTWPKSSMVMTPAHYPNYRVIYPFSCEFGFFKANWLYLISLGGSLF